MGTSPDEGEADSGQPAATRATENGDGLRAEAEVSVTSEVTSPTSPVTNAAPAAVPAENTAPAVVISAVPDGQPAQNTTLTLSGEAAAEARAAPEPTSQGSGSPVAWMTPTPVVEPAEQGPAGFAAMAMQMDQMMAEMASRPGPAWPRAREDDDDAPAASPVTVFGDTQDRLDALFDRWRGDDGGDRETDSRDPFAEAQGRIDALLGRNPLDETDPVPSADGGPVTAALDDARARLDDLLDRTGTDRDAPTAPPSSAPIAAPLDAARDRLDALDGDRETEGPPAPSTLLAQLFDGDDAPPFAGFGTDDLAERFGDLEDFVPDLPGPAFGPAGWDDLPDFG